MGVHDRIKNAGVFDSSGRIRSALVGITSALAMLSAACGAGAGGPQSGGMAGDGMSQMPGMSHPATGSAARTGLSASADGFTFDSPIATLGPGQAQDYRFRIVGPGGTPQTQYAVDQTKLLHFYGIRADLTGFVHVHPTLGSDGTWTAPLPMTATGPYRLYAAFIARDNSGKSHDLVLSREAMVAGPYVASPLTGTSSSVEVDGYTVRMTSASISSTSSQFKLHFDRAGQPVKDLEPYLDTFAHLTAFRKGDLAFAHLHPMGTTGAAQGGPELSFHAELPGAGDYRVFIEFQAGGQLHTTAMTIHAG
jgi:hypothetical protein